MKILGSGFLDNGTHGRAFLNTLLSERGLFRVLFPGQA